MIRGTAQNPPTDAEITYYWLKKIVEIINMKIIYGPFVSYVDTPGNRGTTAMVMIETSHIAFHVWDEKDPALVQFDLYTCSELNTEVVLEEVNKFFNFKDYEYLVFDRENSFILIDGSFLIKEQYDLDKIIFDKITNYDI
jgi:S-adenosylmethionine/arginine decarboxylase-like enzyme